VRPFVPGLALLAAPDAYLTLLLGRSAAVQTWLVGAEVLVLAALLMTRPAVAPAPVLVPAPT
jgi:hypothetical protein